MTATEALGRLFQFELDLLSMDPNIPFEELLGQNVTVRLELPQDKTRYFNGFVSRFSQEGTLDDFNAYSMTVHPWLWFLTRTADCRIFQEMTVPDIIKQVFRDHGFTDFEEALSGSPTAPGTYCVQYRETDFNFVSRLMEQEGIYYYFQARKQQAHARPIRFGQLPRTLSRLRKDTLSSRRTSTCAAREHHIHEWTISQEVQPGVYALNDYDFEHPKANLQVKSSIPAGTTPSPRWKFSTTRANTSKPATAKTYVRARIEELQAEYEQVQGQSNARGLSVGSLFQLVDYPREDQNREYLVVSATHELESDAYSSRFVRRGGRCLCLQLHRPAQQTALSTSRAPPPNRWFRARRPPSWWAPRARRSTPTSTAASKSSFTGTVTAKTIKTAPAGYGFPILGRQELGIGGQIPRIGQEVIVEFLEGDPDRPIITGRVYNDNRCRLSNYQVRAWSAE